MGVEMSDEALFVVYAVAAAGAVGSAVVAYVQARDAKAANRAMATRVERRTQDRVAVAAVIDEGNILLEQIMAAKRRWRAV
jgi:hypothetical protein